MTLGEKVKFVREKLFLSQVNLAKELVVSPLAVIRLVQEQTRLNFKSQMAFHDLCERHKIVFDDSCGDGK